MLQNNYKRITGYIISCVNTLVSFFKIAVQSKYSIALPKADAARCIVLATGPSLKTSFQNYPEQFKTTPLICVNSFAVSEEYVLFKPAYYVILDPFFWQQQSEVTQKTFTALKQLTTWKLHLFVPQYAFNASVFKDLAATNANIQITPFNYTVFKGLEGVAHWVYAKNLAMPQSMNVVSPALFLGINMGFKEVCLVGADHTWHENLYMSEDNVLHNKVAHFYENEVEVKYVPFYKGSVPERGTRKAHDFFDIWSRTFYSYILIERYAKSRQCTIYNASEQSFIDAFKRKKLQ